MLLLPLVLSMSGCIYLVVGGVGAVGGYIVSPDTVEGLTEHDRLAVWDAAMEVVSIMGIIEEDDKDAATINAKVNGADVTIMITPVGQSTVKLSVKARKYYLPKISLAQDIFVKIMNYLDT
jgi:hypothetical protein